VPLTGAGFFMLNPDVDLRTYSVSALYDHVLPFTAPEGTEPTPRSAWTMRLTHRDHDRVFLAHIVAAVYDWHQQPDTEAVMPVLALTARPGVVMPSDEWDEFNVTPEDRRYDSWQERTVLRERLARWIGDDTELLSAFAELAETGRGKRASWPFVTIIP